MIKDTNMQDDTYNFIFNVSEQFDSVKANVCMCFQSDPCSLLTEIKLRVVTENLFFLQSGMNTKGL